MKTKTYNLEPIIRYERTKKENPYLRFVKGGVYLSTEAVKIASNYKYLDFSIDKENKVFGINFTNEKGPNSHIIPKNLKPSQKFISSIKTTDCLEDLMAWNLSEEKYKVPLEVFDKKENLYIAHLKEIEKQPKRNRQLKTKLAKSKAKKPSLKEIEKTIKNSKKTVKKTANKKKEEKTPIKTKTSTQVKAIKTESKREKVDS